MNRWLFLVPIIFTVGCGKSIQIDNELMSYVKTFESKYNVKISSDVQFGKTTLPVVGYCEDNGFSKSIVINKEEFDKFTSLQKENLMLHELGHCELNRNHTEETERFEYYSVPKSLMYPYVFNSFQIKAYSSDKEKYLAELIGNKNK